MFLGVERDRLHTQAIQLERVEVLTCHPRPADPRAAAFDQHWINRRHKSPRAFRPRSVVGTHHRKAVGDDHQRVGCLEVVERRLVQMSERTSGIHGSVSAHGPLSLSEPWMAVRLGVVRHLRPSNRRGLSFETINTQLDGADVRELEGNPGSPDLQVHAHRLLKRNVAKLPPGTFGEVIRPARTTNDKHTKTAPRQHPVNRPKPDDTTRHGSTPGHTMPAPTGRHDRNHDQRAEQQHHEAAKQHTRTRPNRSPRPQRTQGQARTQRRSTPRTCSPGGPTKAPTLQRTPTRNTTQRDSTARRRTPPNATAHPDTQHQPRPPERPRWLAPNGWRTSPRPGIKGSSCPRFRQTGPRSDEISSLRSARRTADPSTYV